MIHQRETNSMYLPKEFRRGVALYVESELLRRSPATRVVLTPDAEPTYGPHYFVCMDTNGSTVWLVPCSSHTGPERLPLSVGEKYGHPKWVRPVTYVFRNQVWRVDLDGLRLARLNDLARHDRANGVHGAGLKRVALALPPALSEALGGAR